MTNKMPARFESWEDADAAFGRFQEAFPLRREQLRRRLAATGGPELDGSIESLTPLAAWYFDAAMRDHDDDMDWWPEWLSRPDASWQVTDENPRLLSPQFVRLWELVGIYIADVVVPLVPHARWVCWRAKAARELTAGNFVLDLGDASFPYGVLSTANPNLSVWYRHYGTGDRFDKPLDPSEVEDEARRAVYERDMRRRDRPLTWQKAPTGPAAFRRTPKPDW